MHLKHAKCEMIVGYIPVFDQIMANHFLSHLSDVV
jgi:hypothetical protein